MRRLIVIILALSASIACIGATKKIDYNKSVFYKGEVTADKKSPSGTGELYVLCSGQKHTQDVLTGQFSPDNSVYDATLTLAGGAIFSGEVKYSIDDSGTIVYSLGQGKLSGINACTVYGTATSIDIVEGRICREFANFASQVTATLKEKFSPNASFAIQGGTISISSTAISRGLEETDIIYACNGSLSEDLHCEDGNYEFICSEEVVANISKGTLSINKGDDSFTYDLANDCILSSFSEHVTGGVFSYYDSDVNTGLSESNRKMLDEFITLPRNYLIENASANDNIEYSRRIKDGKSIMLAEFSGIKDECVKIIYSNGDEYFGSLVKSHIPNNFAGNWHQAAFLYFDSITTCPGKSDYYDGILNKADGSQVVFLSGYDLNDLRSEVISQELAYHEMLSKREMEAKYKELVSRPFVKDGIKYELLTHETVTVLPIEDWGYYGNISIPDTISVMGHILNVTEISGRAFENCRCLTSIVLPNSLKSIKSQAFSGCINIRSIDIPDSIEVIEDFCFDGCTKLKDIKWGDSISSIGASAFRGCSSLESLEIPSTVKSIGYAAFQLCSSLKKLNLVDGLEKISGSAFHDCKNIKSVIIPKSVHSIGDNAFRNCEQLANVTFANKDYTINYSAFTNTIWGKNNDPRAKNITNNPRFKTQSIIVY